MEWVIQVKYQNKTHNIKATLEYKDEDVLQIRVYGSKSTMLLECPAPEKWARKGFTDPPFHWVGKEGDISLPPGKERDQFNKELLQGLRDKVFETWEEFKPYWLS